jgi:hypothetical protein
MARRQKVRVRVRIKIGVTVNGPGSMVQGQWSRVSNPKVGLTARGQGQGQGLVAVVIRVKANWGQYEGQNQGWLTLTLSRR